MEDFLGAVEKGQCSEDYERRGLYIWWLEGRKAEGVAIVIYGDNLGLKTPFIQGDWLLPLYNLGFWGKTGRE